jgi:hypothetical protein
MLAILGTLVVALLIGPFLLIGAGGLLLLLAALLPSTPRRARETFRCPWTGKLVTVEFVLPAGAAQPSEVASCTTFRNSGRVTCQQACREFAEIRWGLSRGVFPRWALTAGGVVTWRSVTEPAPAR